MVSFISKSMHAALFGSSPDRTYLRRKTASEILPPVKAAESVGSQLFKGGQQNQPGDRHQTQISLQITTCSEAGDYLIHLNLGKLKYAASDHLDCRIFAPLEPDNEKKAPRRACNAYNRIHDLEKDDKGLLLESVA